MARFPLRSAAGAAILVFVGAAYVLAAHPEHRSELPTGQDEGAPAVNAPPRLQENSTVNAPLRTASHIPPIDVSPPRKVETATFALG